MTEVRKPGGMAK